MNEHPRGLSVTVMRRADGNDFTLKGISSRFNALTVVGTIDEEISRETVNPLPSGAQKWEASEDRPAVYLVKRGTGRGVSWHLRPADEPVTRHSMEGGNVALIDDARLTLITGWKVALPIHDRFEW